MATIEDGSRLGLRNDEVLRFIKIVPSFQPGPPPHEYASIFGLHGSLQMYLLFFVLAPLLDIILPSFFAPI